MAPVVADMDILVMGDWGGSSLRPYTTPAERNTAKYMAERASAANVDVSMVWGLGDNFYIDGVIDEHDPRFQTTFEDVFFTNNSHSHSHHSGGSAKSLLNEIPFYMVAGNHDHYGNVSGEIAYQSPHNNRWVFPDFYYTKTWVIPSSETVSPTSTPTKSDNVNANGNAHLQTAQQQQLQLVMIDTVLLCDNVQDMEYCDYMNIPREECVLELPYPPFAPASDSDSADADVDVAVKTAEDQWQWLNATLSASTADFLIVAGHYPVWSVAEHGPSQCLVDRLRPLLIQYNVQMYLCGHDHTFELLIEDDEADLLYGVIGGAHVCDPSVKHIDAVPKGSLKFHDCGEGGFAQININNEGIALQYYFGNSSVMEYATQRYPSRNSN